jgi:hypothetical protein
MPKRFPPKPKRWWYDIPRRGWEPKDWLIPYIHFYRCGDEFCNDTLFIRIPLLGHITIRMNRHIRINNKCDECVTTYGPWCPGCQECHRGPRCHDWVSCDHEAKVVMCPACGGDYCPTCEPNPKQSCPYRGNQE